MEQLYLVTAFVEYSHEPENGYENGYARQLLTPERLQYLLDFLDYFHETLRKHPGAKKIVVEDAYGIEFVHDELYDVGKGPVGLFRHRMETADESILLGTVNEEADIQECQDIWIHVSSGRLFWTAETHDERSYESYWVSEKYLRIARCLLCPDNELPAALYDLIDWAPERLVDWLIAGRICADDGSFPRALPSLSPNRLAPLLQHADPKIREKVILALPSLNRGRTAFRS